MGKWWILLISSLICFSGVVSATQEASFTPVDEQLTAGQIHISATINITVEQELLAKFSAEGIEKLITDLIEYQPLTMPTIENILTNKPIEASHNTERAIRAIDGTYDTSWTARAKPPYWLVVDLGESYLLTHWTLNLRSSYPPNSYTNKSSLNATDFSLHISDDGNDWHVLDIVEANNQGVCNRSLDLVEARYVMLLITKPSSLEFNQDIVLYEWELYGIKSDNYFDFISELVSPI